MDSETPSDRRLSLLQHQLVLFTMQTLTLSVNLSYAAYYISYSQLNSERFGDPDTGETGKLSPARDEFFHSKRSRLSRVEAALRDAFHQMLQEEPTAKQAFTIRKLVTREMVQEVYSCTEELVEILHAMAERHRGGLLEDGNGSGNGNSNSNGNGNSSNEDGSDSNIDSNGSNGSNINGNNGSTGDGQLHTSTIHTVSLLKLPNVLINSIMGFLHVYQFVKRMPDMSSYHVSQRQLSVLVKELEQDLLPNWKTQLDSMKLTAGMLMLLDRNIMHRYQRDTSGGGSPQEGTYADPHRVSVYFEWLRKEISLGELSGDHLEVE